MQDQLIGFETAKLAKEKGFKELSRAIYSVSGKLVEMTNINSNEPMPSAPTQSLLQKWLREERGIHIEVKTFSNTDGFEYDVSILPKKYGSWVRLDATNTYEEALEIGLIEALKLIE